MPYFEEEKIGTVTEFFLMFNFSSLHFVVYFLGLVLGKIFVLKQPYFVRYSRLL